MMKCGLALPCVHSVLAMTHRSRVPLLPVGQVSSLNRPPPCGGLVLLPLLSQFSLELAVTRAFKASPKMKSTPFKPHHSISASPAKPSRPAEQSAWASVRHDPRDLLGRAGKASMFRRPQLRRQQMPAAEDVQRHIAVAIVIAVKERRLRVYPPAQDPAAGHRGRSRSRSRAQFRTPAAHPKVSTACSTCAGGRRSMKRPANRSTIPIARSVGCNSSAPTDVTLRRQIQPKTNVSRTAKSTALGYTLSASGRS